MFSRIALGDSPGDRVRLSWATREAFERGQPLRLSEHNAREVIGSTLKPTRLEQLELILDYLDRNTSSGRPVALDAEHDYPIAYADNALEFTSLLEQLVQGKQIDCKDEGVAGRTVFKDGTFRDRQQAVPPTYVLTFAGQERVEATKRRPRGATGWDRVDRSLKEAEQKLSQATTEEQFQSVGHVCRETLISLGQAVYDPERHPITDGKKASPTDAVRMLEAYIAKELQGGGSDETRAVVKKADALADALQHKRTADFRTAALCLEAVRSLVEMVAIIAGKRDR